MVRLKDIIFVKKIMATEKISIPYGAIKSWTAINNETLIDNISIPYGAIKRKNISFCLNTYKNISIPYGAIKSLNIGYKFSVVL